jgi:hypothetical protein
MNSRRTFLARAARALAGGAAASLAPAAPVQAAPAENPELLALGEQLRQTLTDFHAATARKAEARDKAERLCPPVPNDIVVDEPSRLCASYTEFETDVEGNEREQERRIIVSAQARQAVRNGYFSASRRTKAGREFWHKVAVAEQYEAQRAAAIEEAGLNAAMEAEHWAAVAVERIARKIGDIEPRTMAGVVILARALIAFDQVAEISNGNPQRATLLLGNTLAEAVERVGGVPA